MGAELHRRRQYPVGNGPAHARRHIIALQVSDHAVFDVVHQRRMAVKQRAGVHIQIPDAGFGQRVQNHIQDEIAVAQMMMEGNPHARFDAGQGDDLLQRMYDLIHINARSFPAQGLPPFR